MCKKDNLMIKEIHAYINEDGTYRVNMICELNQLVNMPDGTVYHLEDTVNKEIKCKLDVNSLGDPALAKVLIKLLEQ